MKCSTRAATGIAVGYLLGRNRKFRTAAMMTAATAVGGGAIGGLVMKRGMKMLGSSQALEKISPQLGELVDTVKGDLLNAGKAAVTAAVANQVDALTDSIHERTERLLNPEAVVAEGAGKAADTGRAAAGAGGRAAAGTARRATSTASSAGGSARRMAGRGRAEPDETQDDDYDTQDEYEGDDYEDEAPEDEAPEDEAPEDEAPEDDREDVPADDRGNEVPAPRRPATSRRPAVSRTRR